MRGLLDGICHPDLPYRTANKAAQRGHARGITLAPNFDIEAMRTLVGPEGLCLEPIRSIGSLGPDPTGKNRPGLWFTPRSNPDLTLAVKTTRFAFPAVPGNSHAERPKPGIYWIEGYMMPGAAAQSGEILTLSCTSQ